MSWFPSTALNSAFDTFTDTVQTATKIVQDAIPEEQKEFLAKLTLNTDEMISERQNFRDEATRKEEAKTRLDKLLPWETLDLEREILVEECKDAILLLSSRRDTFFGPYEMPLLNVQLEVEDTEEEENENQSEAERTEDDDGEENALTDDAEANNTVGEEIEEEEEEDKESKPQRFHMEPSEESREKLAKLEPLPPLLEDFDLDAHVGLIQKLLKEDPELVNMQATLSGGGAREKVFWRNYFFHCAFTRYEAGLSIDEIWSYQEESNIVNQPETISTECIGDANISSTTVTGSNEEEAIIFDGSGDEDIDFQNIDEVTKADALTDMNGDGAGTDTSLTALSEGSPNNGFELVDEDVDDDTEDPVLDELEAEIARELED